MEGLFALAGLECDVVQTAYHGHACEVRDAERARGVVRHACEVRDGERARGSWWETRKARLDGPAVCA